MGELKVDGLVYRVLSDGSSAALIGWYGAAPSGDVTVPALVTSGNDIYVVASLESPAGGGGLFSDAPVTSLSLPATIEKIADGALSGCPSLSHIHVSSGNDTFSSFDGMLFSKDLSSLLLVPEGKEGAARIPDQTATVPASAFSRCVRLPAVEVGEGNATFSSRNGILYSKNREALLACPPGAGEAVVVPKGVEAIGAGAFAGCAVASITVLGDVQEIAPDAFDDASRGALVALLGGEGYGFRRVVWEAAGFSRFAEPAHPGDMGGSGGSGAGEVLASGFSYTLLDDYTLSVAWAGSEGPTGDLEVPATAEVGGAAYRVSTVAASGFAGSAELKSVTLPACATSIGEGAFAGCTSLASVTLPEGLHTVGARAFEATGLSDIWLPASVEQVGARAFAGCSGLARVVALGVPQVADDVLAGCSGVTVYCPRNADEAYPWNVGLYAAGNHIRPYGVQLSVDALEIPEGRMADLFEGGWREVPEGCEISFGYGASSVSVETDGTVKAKAAGPAEVTVTLELDGRTLARASRSIEVLYGAMPLVPDNPMSVQKVMYSFNAKGGAPEPPEQSYGGVEGWNAGLGWYNASTPYYCLWGSSTTPCGANKPAKDPELTGYVFGGWSSGISPSGEKIWKEGSPYYADFEEENVEFGERVGGDSWAPVYAYVRFTFNAVWTPITYNITFDSNGALGSAPGSVNNVAYDSNVTLPSNPFSKPGFRFVGWNTQQGGGASTRLSPGATSVPPNLTAEDGKTVTLYAEWEAIFHTVTFETNGGSEVAAQTVNHGEAVKMPAEPVREGYDFDGWFIDAGLNDRYTFGAAVTADITLHAKWSIKRYMVTFNPNNGSTATIAKVNYRATVAKPSPDPERTGYSFDGWYTDEDLRNGYDFSTPVTADVTLHAKWILRSYQLDYRSDGTVVKTVQVPFGSTLAGDYAAPSLEKEGYTLQSWKNDTADWNFVAGTMPAKPLTLIAAWEPVSYRAVFNGNGGSLADGGVTSSQTLVFDRAENLDAGVYMRLGYAFKGWSKSSVADKVDYTATAEVKNLANTQGAQVNLYAVWEANPYTVVFHANHDDAGGTATRTQGFVYDETGKGLAANTFSREGWRFEKWTANPDGSGAAFGDGAIVSKPLAASGQYHLYAQWTRNVYNVAFATNGGSYVEPLQVEFGRSFAAPTTTLEGRSLEGWYDNPQLTGKKWDFGHDTVPVGGVTLYAKWTPNTFAVSFQPGGGAGSPGATRLFTYGAANQNLPTVSSLGFSWEGRTFSHWSTNADGTGKHFTDGADVSTGLSTGSAVTLHAQWTLNVYEVVFKANGGSAVSSRDVGHGAAVERPADPEYPGYTFGGWYEDAAFAQEYEFAAPVTGPLILYAKWDPVRYAVTFDANGGERAPDAETAAAGALVPEPQTAPIWSGHVFAGWCRDVEGTQPWRFGEDAMPARDLVLYAKWEEAERLMYVLNEDGASLSVGVNPDFRSTLREAIVPSKYEFEGAMLPVTRVVGRDAGSSDSLGGFEDCALLERVVLPEGIAVLGEAAFENCSLLAAVDLPNTVVAIGESSFSGCSALVSFAVPSGVEAIGAWAFLGCTRLSAVTLPAGLASIGEHAFQRCTALASVGLPERLSSIGEAAFAEAGLAAVELPASLASIGADAFKGCGSLASVFAFGGMVGAGVAGAFDDAAKSNARVFLPMRSTDGRETFAQMAAAWGIGADGYGFVRVNAAGGDLPMVDSVGRATWSFALDADGSGLGTLLIEEVEEGVIGTLWQQEELSVYGGHWSPLRNAVRKVEMGPGLAAKDTVHWFDDMVSLSDVSSVYVPEGASSLDYMFDCCARLQALPDGFTVPEGVESMEATFRGCSLASLPDSLRLPSTLTKADGLFGVYRGVRNQFTHLPEGFLLPSGLENADYLFKGCSKLEALPEGFSLPQGLRFAKALFAWCNSLGALPVGFTIPESVEYADQMFQDCTALQALPEGFSVPQSYTGVDAEGQFVGMNSMFEGCSALASLPDSFDFPLDVAERSTKPFMCVTMTDTYYGGPDGNVTKYAWAGQKRSLVRTVPEGRHRVSFVVPDTQGGYGDAWASVLSDAADKLAEPAAPALEGNVFAGWYTSADCTVKFDFSRSVGGQGLVGDRLYAKYLASRGPLPTTDGAFNASWSLSPDGRLTIEGTAPVADFEWSFEGQQKYQQHWGPVRAFVKSVDTTRLAGAPSMCHWFFNMDALVDLSALRFPDDVTNIAGLVSECDVLADLPEDFTVPEGVTTVNTLFNGCKSLRFVPEGFRLPLGVNDASYLFARTPLERLPEEFTFPRTVHNLEAAFRGCEQLKALPAGFILPPDLESASAMLMDCKSLTALPESFRFPENLGICGHVFKNCVRLSSLPEGLYVPQGVSTMEGLFDGCSSLRALPKSFDFPLEKANAAERPFMCETDTPTYYAGSSPAVHNYLWSSQQRTLVGPEDPLPDGMCVVTFQLKSETTGRWATHATALTATGDTVADPGDPGRFGYPFEGWFLDKECTRPFPFGEPVTRDLVVYGSFGAPILRCEVPVAAEVTVDATGAVVDAPLAFRSFTPTTTVVTAVRSSLGAGAGKLLPQAGQRNGVKARLSLGNDVVFKLDGGSAPLAVAMERSTGFTDPRVAEGTFGLDLAGAQIAYHDASVGDVAFLSWAVEVRAS